MTICIALTAMLFATLLGVYQGMIEPFDRLQANLNASHILMNFDQNIHNAGELKTWFEAQPKVDKVTPPKLAKFIAKPLLFEGREFTNVIRLIEHWGNAEEQDEVILLQGEAKEYPGPGEIWIPNHYLNKESIGIGDTIFVSTENGAYPLVVSAIIVEPHLPNGLSGLSFAFVGKGGLSMMFPVSQLSGVQMGIRMKNAEDTEAVWAKFNREFIYNGSSLRYELFKRIFQILYQIIAGLLTAFAILGIFITIIITITVVNSAIRSDYKMIGMLKSQGFTNLNVNTVYIIQFLLITIVAIPLGLIGAYFMVQVIFKNLITAIGAVNFEVSWVTPTIFTFLTFIVGILIITYLTARKAANISPVTAIRFGGPPPKSFKPSKSRFFALRPNSYLPVFLGWRFLLSNKKRAFTLFIGLVFAIIVQLFYINGSGSSFSIGDNRSGWGISEADLRVSQGLNFRTFEEDTFKADIEEDDRVEVVVPIGRYEARLPANQNSAPKYIEGTVFGDDPEILGLNSLEGRHPVFEDEISLGVVSSENLGKIVGDTLSLFMEGQLLPFIVVGTYQSINELGQGFRIRAEGITEHNPLFQLRGYNIILEKGVDKMAFKTNLEQTYGDTYKIREFNQMEETLVDILAGLKDVIFLISLLFLSVLAVTVFNDTILSIRENQRNLGIYKALGMTPLQLQIALLFKALLVAILALLIAFPIAAYGIGPILSLLTADIGLVQIPYVHKWKPSLIAIPIVLLLTMGSVFLASRGVLRVKPRVLVRE